MTPDPPGNGWDRYQVFVLEELKRVNHELNELRDAVGKCDRDILTLKVKAATWGGIAGFALSLIPTLVKWLGGR
jgi:hypothetical protein